MKTIINLFIFLVFSPSFAQAKNETKLEWLDLTFDGIKKNKIDYKKNASGKFDLHKITVNQSASPLFLPMNKKISNITVKGSVQIIKPITSGPSWKDQYFNLGVIYEGDYKPGFFARVMMPTWLLTLYKNADQNLKGIGNIEFFGVFKGSKVQQKTTENFNLKIIKTYGTTLDPKNQFELKVKPKDRKILALWFHADGDDTKAQFTTVFDSIQYQ